jgi:hypothetical protein
MHKFELHNGDIIQFTVDESIDGTPNDRLTAVVRSAEIRLTYKEGRDGPRILEESRANDLETFDVARFPFQVRRSFQGGEDESTIEHVNLMVESLQGLSEVEQTNYLVSVFACAAVELQEDRNTDYMNPVVIETIIGEWIWPRAFRTKKGDDPITRGGSEYACALPEGTDRYQRTKTRRAVDTALSSFWANSNDPSAHPDNKGFTRESRYPHTVQIEKDQEDVLIASTWRGIRIEFRFPDKGTVFSLRQLPEISQEASKIADKYYMD